MDSADVKRNQHCYDTVRGLVDEFAVDEQGMCLILTATRDPPLAEGRSGKVPSRTSRAAEETLRWTLTEKLWVAWFMF